MCNVAGNTVHVAYVAYESLCTSHRARVTRSSPRKSLWKYWPMSGKHQGALCNIGYPPQTHLKLKSHKILFIYKIHFICVIILKFCTEHGSINAMLCAKLQNDYKCKCKINYGQTRRHKIWVWDAFQADTCISYCISPRSLCCLV